MAEVLVHIVDHPLSATNIDVRVRVCNRGDYVHHGDDGYAWTARELSAPQWRIFRVPMTAEEIDAYRAEEQDPSGTKNRKWFRQRYLDLSKPSFSQDLKDYIADDTRAAPIFVVVGANVAKVKGAITDKGPADNQT